jgi:hypothetical protein
MLNRVNIYLTFINNVEEDEHDGAFICMRL